MVLPGLLYLLKGGCKVPYSIVITETLSRVVSVDAESPDGAVEKVRSLYHESEIVLDSSNFVDVDFAIKEL